MTAELRDLHLELLQQVALAKGRWRGSPLTAFAALRGAEGSDALMVVGRAVNGWTHDWRAQDVSSASVREKVVKETFAPTVWHDGRPMLWVSERWGKTDGYNTRKSAFWRVVRSTVAGLGIADVQADAWPTSVSWSNLYKVAPAAGGNPTSALIDVQVATCVKILRQEIQTWSPRRVLFLTGRSWANAFLQALNFQPDSALPINPVEASGTLFNGARAVVVPHPQARSEKSLVAAIVRAFGVA
jgi:hypothetical protein